MGRIEKIFFFHLRKAKKSKSDFSQHAKCEKPPAVPLVLQGLVDAPFESDECMMSRSIEFQIQRDVGERLDAIKPVLEAQSRTSKLTHVNVHTAKGLVDHEVLLRCNVAKHSGFQYDMNVNQLSPKQLRLLQKGLPLPSACAADPVTEVPSSASISSLVKIQAWVRGAMARTKFVRMKLAHSLVKQSSFVHDCDLLFLGDAYRQNPFMQLDINEGGTMVALAESAAALKIQIWFRGLTLSHAARQHTDNLVDTDKEIGSSSDIWREPFFQTGDFVYRKTNLETFRFGKIIQRKWSNSTSQWAHLVEWHRKSLYATPVKEWCLENWIIRCVDA